MRCKVKILVLGVLAAFVVGVLTMFGCAQKEVFTINYEATEGGVIIGKLHQIIEKGASTEQVEAIPNEGYIFVGWSDGNIEPTRFEESVCQNNTFIAKFEVDKEETFLSAQYGCSVGGNIVGDVYQKIKYGEDGESVTAVAMTGYKFVKWSDGITDANRMDKHVVLDIDVTAEFEFLFEGGTGMNNDPFVISTYEQLRNIYYYPASNFVLGCDIDTKNVIHEPIFTYKNEFLGVLDGNGFTIKNLTINTDTQFPSLMGFIGYGGICRNINIDNGNITLHDFDTPDRSYAAGMLAGVSYGNLENINVSGKICGDGLYHTNIFIGAIAGFSQEGNIKNCVADIIIELNGVMHDNDVTSLNDANFNVGGIVGAIMGSSMENCVATGSIIVMQSDQYLRIGGMTGRYLNNFLDSNFSIIDCQTDVIIESTNKNAQTGGLMCLAEIRQTATTTVKNCISKGKMTVNCASGFIYEAINHGSLIIQNCRSESDIVATNKASGFIWFADNVNINNCSVIGSVVATYINGSGGSGGYAVGFCYDISQSKIAYCYSECAVRAVTAVSFIFTATESDIAQCYSTGNIVAVLHGAGFVFYQNGGHIENCYSVSNVHSTCTNENIGRTVIAGFGVGIYHTEIKNCYYAGKVSGAVYAHGSTTAEPIVATFAGVVNNADIVNCHVLNNSMDFAPKIIDITRNNDSKIIDVTVYENTEDMYQLADKLNEKASTLIWKGCDYGLPQIIMLAVGFFIFV